MLLSPLFALRAKLAHAEIWNLSKLCWVAQFGAPHAQWMGQTERKVTAASKELGERVYARSAVKLPMVVTKPLPMYNPRGTCFLAAICQCVRAVLLVSTADDFWQTVSLSSTSEPAARQHKTNDIAVTTNALWNHFLFR